MRRNRTRNVAAREKEPIKDDRTVAGGVVMFCIVVVSLSYWMSAVAGDIKSFGVSAPHQCDQLWWSSFDLQLK